MRRSAEAAALLITTLLKNSGQKRGRVSERTVRRLSKRQRLRSAFLGEVQRDLDDYGVIMVELDIGGYGVMQSSVLEGAPAITAKKYLTEELEELKKNEGVGLSRLRKRLEEETAAHEEDE